MVKFIAGKLGAALIAWIYIVSSWAIKTQHSQENGAVAGDWWKNGYVAVQGTETRVKAKFEAIISYYTADPAQTDDTPCVTADGTDICKGKENIVAANGLKFGTKVRVDGVVYRVADRMNRRYPQGYMDILVKSKAEAIKLGRQTKIVEILE